MRRVDGLAEVLPAREDVVTALYVSAGHDTAPFAFLHRSFLERRGVGRMPTPDVYVYVDRDEPRGRVGAPLTFDDGVTVVTTDGIDELNVAGSPSWLLRVSYAGQGTDEKGSATVLRIRATNQEVYRLCAESDWSPDVFIAVKDGCRFGGQDDGRCENMLQLEGSPISMLPHAPRWWVTDHFGDHLGRIPKGYTVRSRDPAFPVGFEKVALLSSRWGFAHALFGATVFRVIETEEERARLRLVASG